MQVRVHPEFRAGQATMPSVVKDRTQPRSAEPWSSKNQKRFGGLRLVLARSVFMELNVAWEGSFFANEAKEQEET